MKVILPILFFFSFFAQAQTPTQPYTTAFSSINQMLNGTTPPSFKQAVFISENAYYNNENDYEKFNKNITAITNICRGIVAQRQFLYHLPDSQKVKKQAAIFTTLKDTTKLQMKDGNIYNHLPFTYDFTDFAGNNDWSKMFVTKLLLTHTGNCHSLPFLYKIIAEELGETAYLSLAPNHIYIKLQCKKDGWYNTELTSGEFPNDAWLMASGYISLASIQSGIYMDTISLQQSIAICLIDLAKGYERKVKTNNEQFVLQCCDTTLKYYPNYINALLLKAETTKKLFEKIMHQSNVQYPSQAMYNPKAKELFDNMQALYKTIHDLGYRKMPDKMYADWLHSLQTEKEKYQNKNLTHLTK